MTSPLNLLIYGAVPLKETDTAGESAVFIEEAGPTMSLFTKGLSARYLQAKPLDLAPRFLANPHRFFPFSDGRFVYLPRLLDIFESRPENWTYMRLSSAVQAGQWEWGTFDRPDTGNGQAVWELPFPLDHSDHLSWIRFFIGQFPIPGLAGDIFITLETARVASAVTRRFKGLAADLEWYLPRATFLSQTSTLPRGLLWSLFVALFDPREVPDVRWPFQPVLEITESIVLPGASLKSSLQLTISVYAILEPLFKELRSVDRLSVPDWGDFDFLGRLPGRDRKKVNRLAALDLKGGFAAIEDELAESIEELKFVTSRVPSGLGNFLTEELSEKGRCEAEGKREPATGVSGAKEDEKEGPQEGRRTLYPEWDYIRRTYLRDWVSVWSLDRLQVVESAGKDLLGEWEDLVNKVSHQFRMLRYEERAWRKRLLDGEEIELDQALQGEVERRVGITPSEKLYMEKHRKGRDVSAFLLVDLSASTSFKIEEGDHQGWTVLEVLLASVAIMSQALEQLGDRYGVYGFSGYGRKRVELQCIKQFDENLSQRILTGMGQMRSQQSTRMGAAVRHAHHVLSAEPAALRLLLVLSDGFPQDCDYGEDRNDREYGLQDTARALLETEMDGIIPFCISVDTAGHDYLRRMCSPRTYMVVNSVQDLPGELPKIYMRLRNQ